MNIVANRKGYRPTRAVVNVLLAEMKKGGLISDWDSCTALSDHALLFTDNDEEGPSIVAVSVNNLYKFMTLTEYLQRPCQPRKASGIRIVQK